MAPEMESLVLEHLRHIYNAVDALREGADAPMTRLGRVEVRLAERSVEVAEQSVRIDKLTVRLDRIERRLELTDA